MKYLEELREDFAKKLIDKIKCSQFLDFDDIEGEDELLATEVEDYLVELCQMVLDEAIIVKATMSEYTFLTLPSNKECVMSEANRRIEIGEEQ